VKESLKDMEKKKQGTYPPMSFTWYPEQDTEKLDDAKARARIKAQVEADKRERAEKAARENALREGGCKFAWRVVDNRMLRRSLVTRVSASRSQIRIWEFTVHPQLCEKLRST
jgi:hypothetical protein